MHPDQGNGPVPATFSVVNVYFFFRAAYSLTLGVKKPDVCLVFELN